MRSASTQNLRLGSHVIALLLPQRRPFLMVDCVTGFAPGPPPVLEGSRHITANEVFFDGHFPGLHIWPGTLTLEGLGQCSAILMGLLAMRRAAEAEGRDPEEALEALRNLERGYRLHPGFRPDAAAALLERMSPLRQSLAVGASAEVKFLQPVFAGQRLDYRVAITNDLGDKLRCECEASVDGTVVVTAVMVGARLTRPPLP
jgi:3-hydroxyacyl-[acyl-carrier-protein] dehydratase